MRPLLHAPVERLLTRVLQRKISEWKFVQSAILFIQANRSLLTVQEELTGLRKNIIFELETGRGKPRPYNVENEKCRGRACPCPDRIGYVIR